MLEGKCSINDSFKSVWCPSLKYIYNCYNSCIEFNIQMVQRPQNPPQICGHWKLSPQFKKGIQAWMASRARSSRFQGESNLFVWFRLWSHRQISSKKTSLPLIEWPLLSQLYVVPSQSLFHISCELCSPHVGIPTLWKVTWWFIWMWTLFYLPCLIYLSLSIIPGEFIREGINLFQCWLLVKVRKIRVLKSLK